MSERLLTEKHEGEPHPELGGMRICKEAEKKLMPFPGMNAQDVVIRQMIAANQILRDQLMDLRDERVVHYCSMRTRILELEDEIRALRRRKKKAAVRRKRAK